MLFFSKQVSSTFLLDHRLRRLCYEDFLSGCFAFEFLRFLPHAFLEYSFLGACLHLSKYEDFQLVISKIGTRNIDEDEKIGRFCEVCFRFGVGVRVKVEALGFEF